MDDRAKRSEVMQEKLYNWAVKILVKLDKVSKPIGSERTNYFEIYPHEKSIEAFETVYQRLLGEL